MSEETDHNSPEKEKNAYGKAPLNMFMLTNKLGPALPWDMDREGNIRFPGRCPITGASERPILARVDLEAAGPDLPYLIEYAPEILNLFLKEREENERLLKQVQAMQGEIWPPVEFRKDWHSEHPRYLRTYWVEEVMAGHTQLGYWGWVNHQDDIEDDDDEEDYED